MDEMCVLIFHPKILFTSLPEKLCSWNKNQTESNKWSFLTPFIQSSNIKQHFPLLFTISAVSFFFDSRKKKRNILLGFLFISFHKALTTTLTLRFAFLIRSNWNWWCKHHSRPSGDFYYRIYCFFFLSKKSLVGIIWPLLW